MLINLHHVINLIWYLIKHGDMLEMALWVVIGSIEVGLVQM